MSKISIYFLFIVLVFNYSFAQDNDQILLKVEGEPILASEFLRVYNKNLDLVQDESQKDIDGYLKLFIEYQLKLKEASRLELYDNKSYKREFNSYKKQLTNNYLSENKVTDELVREAYNRSKQDINASHILVRLDESEQDTINAYNEVLALRSRVIEDGFEKVKSEMHNGNTIFVEDLGYFSSFKMVYDFETAAYNTEVGEISMPFRTQFGYHVVKVNDKRPSRGTLTAAHIMVSDNQADSLVKPEQRINDIYKKLNQGESFEALAKQFSDDKSSAKNGGKLSPFKSGQLSSLQFEDAAFALKADGDYSKPFKTDYGWHIVKRLNLKSLQDFEAIKPSLETKVKRDSRSKLINTAMVNELKKRYNISYNLEAKNYFESKLTNDFFKRSWRLPTEFKANDTIFTINKSAYSFDDFGRHLLAVQRTYTNKILPMSSIVDKEFDIFFEKSILKYREENLELENEDFANILQEYKDGLVLFDLMEKEVWNKASKDSLGIEAYYKANKENYRWKDRVEVIIATSADKSNIGKIHKMMKKGKSQDEISKSLNTDTEQNVIFTTGIFSVEDSVLPTTFHLKEGVSKVYRHNEAYHVIDVKRILPTALKTLEEARGSIINDYQAQIEKDWINSLYQRFTVEVNVDVLEAIKSKIKK